MKELTEDERLHAAIHEAGHAVVGVLMGGEVDEVYIRREAYFGGLSHGKSGVKFSGMTPRLFQASRYCQAGIAAASRVFRPEYTQGSDKNDIEELRRRYIEEMRGHSIEDHDDEAGFENCCRDALEHASDLVRENWPAIEAVAAALFARERLTGSDVAFLMAHPDRRLP